MKLIKNPTCRFTFAVALFAVTGNCMEVLSGDTDLGNYLRQAASNYTTWLLENQLDPSPPTNSVMKGWHYGVLVDCKLSNHTVRGHSKTVTAALSAYSSFSYHWLIITRNATNDNQCEVHGNIDCTGVLQAGNYFPNLANDLPFSVQGDFHVTTTGHFDNIYMQNVGVTRDYKLDTSYSWTESIMYTNQSSFLLDAKFNDTEIAGVYFAEVQDAFAIIYRESGLNFLISPSFPSSLLFERFVKEIIANIDLREIINAEDLPNPYVPTPSTTTATTTTSTSTESPNPPPQEGDSCNPEDCRNIGYCQGYLRCDKETAKWIVEQCGENLVWNPLNPNGTTQIHGGNCDTWDNLSDAVERQYRTDPDCLGCFWRAVGSCRREYDYQPANGTNRNVLRLSCAKGLVFSEEKETCQRCEDVNGDDGNACC